MAYFAGSYPDSDWFAIVLKVAVCRQVRRLGREIDKLDRLNNDGHSV